MSNLKQYLLHPIIHLFIASFICSGELNAQPEPTWYRHYDIDSLAPMWSAGIEPCENDAVVLLNGASDEPPTNRSALIRLDGENGDIEWVATLDHNPVADSSYLFFFLRGLITLKDGSHIVLVNTNLEQGNIGFALHRIDKNGSIVWHKDYGLPGQDIFANAGGLGIGPDSMSFVVSSKLIDTSFSSTVLLLHHIDENGEVLKLNQHITSLHFYSEDSPVIMLEDSSFVFGFNLLHYSNTAPKILRRVSYEGQLLQTLTTSDNGYWSNLKRHPNGQIVAVSLSYIPDTTGLEPHGMRTTMYNSNLDTIWSRLYNHLELPFLFRFIDFPGPASFDKHGNILVMGDGSAYNGVRPAHLIKYNVNGDVLWIKRFGIAEDVGGFIGGVGGKIAFPTGGILLTGSNIGKGALFIRLDSLGCFDTTDCPTDFLLPSEDQVEFQSIDFQITPNPFDNEIIIKISQEQFQKLNAPIIHIVDLLGKEMISFSLTENWQQLDTAELTSGMYIVIVESRGMIMGVERMVKI